MVLDDLSEMEETHVDCLGGTLRHISAGFVGALAECRLERTTFNTVFRGAKRVLPTTVCEATQVHARLKEMTCSRAGEVNVLAYTSKLNHAPFQAWARLPENWTLLNDAAATEDQPKDFRASGVQILIVE